MLKVHNALGTERQGEMAIVCLGYGSAQMPVKVKLRRVKPVDHFLPDTFKVSNEVDMCRHVAGGSIYKLKNKIKIKVLFCLTSGHYTPDLRLSM